MAIKGYWRLNGNSVDASGNGYSGSDVNISYSNATGKINQGALFNGLNSYINIGNRAGLNFGTGDFTIALWFKTTQNKTGAYPILLSCFNWPSPYYGYDIVLNDFAVNDWIGVEVWSGSAGCGAYASGKRDGLWHFLVGVKTSTKLRLYVDCKLEQESTHSLGSTSSSQSLIFGRNSRSSADFYLGSMDNVLADNGAWGNAAIKNEFSKIKGFF